MAQATRTTQSAALALSTGSPEVRATQQATLLLVPPEPDTRLTQQAALLLGVGEPNARISQGAVLVLAEQTPCVTRWASLWKLVRADGTTFAYTSHDESITYLGVTYKPCAGLEGSAIELGAVSGSVGNQELKGFFDDDDIKQGDLLNGLYDGATVEIWIYPWGNTTGEIPFRITAGIIGKVQENEDGFTAEVLSIGAQLQQQALLEVYSAPCRYKLGGSRCGVELACLTATGTVTSVADRSVRDAASRRQFSDTGRSEVDGWYEYGVLTWTSGSNAGVSVEVKVFADKTFTLWRPMQFEIEIGDEYSVAPGCAKTVDHCRYKFDNYLNYGGFPDVPGNDAIIRTPDSRADRIFPLTTWTY